MARCPLSILNYPFILNSCIIICGPTAIGKTALAIELARHFSTEIISADSRQCYREMTIGVAKPTAAELAAVPHHFINSHSIQDNISAAGFETYALGSIEQIFQKNKMAVMVGGTGLYIRAFCQGLDQIPPVDEKIREHILAQYNSKGIDWLRSELILQDEIFSQKGEMQNPQRMMRALEVKLATGKSIIDFQSKQKKQRPFHIIKICLELPRQELYERIDRRVDQMMQEGLEQEARALWPYKHLNALQTVGYSELFRYFENEISLTKAVELIKQHTRNYAKRQQTWFKKEEGMLFCRPSINEVLKNITGE